MSELVSLLLSYGADPNLIADGPRADSGPRYGKHPPHQSVGLRSRTEEQTSRRGVTSKRRTAAICVPEIPRTWNDHEEWVQPLLLAVQSGDLELVELLLDFDADVNVHCSEFPRGGLGKIYSQVLFWAVEEAHEAMVKLLLERGADPEMTDMVGRPPLSYTVECGHDTIVRSLLDHGANPHRAVDVKGRKLVSYRPMKESIWMQLQEAEEKWTGSVSADA